MGRKGTPIGCWRGPRKSFALPAPNTLPVLPHLGLPCQGSRIAKAMLAPSCFLRVAEVKGSVRAGGGTPAPLRCPPTGVKVLFRVGLILVRLALGTSDQRLACPGLLETLEALRTIPQAQLQEEVFMAQVGEPGTLPGKLSTEQEVRVRTGPVPVLELRARCKPQTLAPPRPQASALSTSWLCALAAHGAGPGFLTPQSSPLVPPPTQVHSVALSEQDLQREIRTQLAQLPASVSGPLPRPQDRLPGAQAVFQAQQLAGLCGDSRKPEVPRIVVQPPEEPRRKPQTRGKTFHGFLTRARGPPIQGSPRAHRGSASFLDTRF